MPTIKDKAAPKKKGSRSKDLGPGVRAHIRYKIDDPDDPTKKKKLNVPGVTTITGQMNKPFLVGWANRLGLDGIDSSKYTEEAQAIGNAAHYLIESKLRGEEPNMDEFTLSQITKAGFGVKAFDDWSKEHTVEPQLLEAVFTSDKYRYGGQIDFYGLIDNVPTLLDFKTSAELYPEHHWQVSGYWNLLREHGHPVKGVRVLRIGRDETEGFTDYTFTGEQIIRGWKIFQALLGLYWTKKEFGK